MLRAFLSSGLTKKLEVHPHSAPIVTSAGPRFTPTIFLGVQYVIVIIDLHSCRGGLLQPLGSFPAVSIVIADDGGRGRSRHKGQSTNGAQ